ncbi:hypothetical protein Taro_041634 [Colocasia esculenta]|uniref:Uncharacterized protein n=1 Tax=Colocasia esculenta TaxID=4460 RepID=A0A843WM87_COLES|nr:hypothetical protein [Colocasia esculenta]
MDADSCRRPDMLTSTIFKHKRCFKSDNTHATLSVIQMFKKFSKTCRSAQQTTLGESSHAQALASHSHVSTSQEGELQTQVGASASQSAHVHSQALASHAGSSVSQFEHVHSQAEASQSGGLHTPRSLPDARNISEHATISPQTPRSASSVGSVIMTLIIYDDYAATFHFSAVSSHRRRHSSAYGRNAKEAKVLLEKKRSDDLVDESHSLG